MIFDFLTDKNIDESAKAAFPGSRYSYFWGLLNPVTSNCGISTDATKYESPLAKPNENHGIFISFNDVSPPIGKAERYLTKEQRENLTLKEHVDVVTIAGKTLRITSLIAENP